MKKREIIMRRRMSLGLRESYEMFLRISMMFTSKERRLSESEISLLSYVWFAGMVINRDSMRESLGLKSSSDVNNRVFGLIKKGYLDNSEGKGVIKVKGSWNLPRDLESLKLGFIIDVINGESESADS
jgi:hypothetical protein